MSEKKDNNDIYIVYKKEKNKIFTSDCIKSVNNNANDAINHTILLKMSFLLKVMDFCNDKSYLGWIEIDKINFGKFSSDYDRYINNHDFSDEKQYEIGWFCIKPNINVLKHPQTYYFRRSDAIEFDCKCHQSKFGHSKYCIDYNCRCDVINHDTTQCPFHYNLVDSSNDEN